MPSSNQNHSLPQLISLWPWQAYLAAATGMLYAACAWAGQPASQQHWSTHRCLCASAAHPKQHTVMHAWMPGKATFQWYWYTTPTYNHTDSSSKHHRQQHFACHTAWQSVQGPAAKQPFSAPAFKLCPAASHWLPPRHEAMLPTSHQHSTQEPPWQGGSQHTCPTPREACHHKPTTATMQMQTLH